MFCTASKAGAASLKYTLELFCHFAGHRVYQSKTQIFFSSNVKEDVARSICRKLGYTRVENLRIYLGMPLFHGRLGINTFQFLIDKVRNKLSRWDVRKLSLVDRLTLVKFVLLSIPNYFMVTTKILVTVCNIIEKITRMFLWGASPPTRKPSLVNYHEYYTLIDNGGLGLRSLHVQNQLFFLKISYNILVNTDAFQVQILRNKYKLLTFIPADIKHANASHFWQALT